MKFKAFALSLLFAAPMATAIAGGVTGGNKNSNWTIYGWQNWSLESVDNGTRDTTRINANAANIGFSAGLNTGMSLLDEPVMVNFRCEQFTFHNRYNGYTNWCNRNSKISLSGSFGEIMFGQWLLPYNEMVAQWVDPFYDAGADSHTSIMGNIGYGDQFFYNGSFGQSDAFNRRQEETIQYLSPDINGLTFRLATTNANQEGSGEEVAVTGRSGETKLDPRIWSMGIAYETNLSSGDNVWLAATYQKHDDWAAVTHACDASDDRSYRLAGRYIHQWQAGQSTQISAMWETLEYDWEGCVDAPRTMTAVMTGNNDIDVERDAWMISGKHVFGDGYDLRFSYMDADELEVDGSNLNDSDAKAYNVGAYYTMPAGTELRLTYSKVANKSASNYDFGINGSGAAVSEDVKMWAVGIVQWF